MADFAHADRIAAWWHDTRAEFVRREPPRPVPAITDLSNAGAARR